MRATIARSSADNPAYEPSSAARWKSTCLNCGAALAGAFCADCGQRAMPPHPTVRELVGDAFAEFSGFDGTFASTVRKLLGTPGELTADVLEGRRRRYVSPLRMYLAASVLYFIVAAAMPATSRNGIDIGGMNFGVSVAAPKTSAPGRVVAAGTRATAGELDSASRQAALKDISRAPRALQPLLRRVVVDPKGFRSAMLQLFPRVLFALVPVFALIVGIFYRHRHYPEHLYFGLHLHAFLFFALTIAAVSKFAGSTISSVVGLGVFAWIVYYGVQSLRRVYGGSVSATLFKGIGVSALYGMASIAGVIGAAYIAAVWG